jgi:hypothetical protein
MWISGCPPRLTRISFTERFKILPMEIPVPIFRKKWPSCVLVLTLACAARGTAQSAPLPLTDNSAVSSTPASTPEDPTLSTGDKAAALNSDSNPAPHLTPPETRKARGFQWKPAVAQSMFLAGISNGWRFWHESGTRDALHGPFLKNWIDSIGETRGWDDSDGWHASYISHPFEGGIFGFIEQQNDPLYRKLEWGDGRIYWAGKLRALAFSAVMSTQWTLGPVSEASLGNVQLHASPGFIDLVNTPLLGISEMMGEDMLDRYVIIALENHTANPFLIMAARAVANPSRTFANMMALK